MQKLEKLTSEQEILLQRFRQDNIDFIINNEKHREKEFQIKDIVDDINWIYQKARLKTRPKFILIAQSFKEEKLMVNYFFNIFGYDIPYYSYASELILKRVVDNIRKQIRNQVKENLYDDNDIYDTLLSGQKNLDGFTKANLSNTVYDQIYDNLCRPVFDQIVDNIYDKIFKQVQNQGYNISSQVKSRLSERIFNQIYEQTGYKITEQLSTKAWHQLEMIDELQWDEQGLGFAFNSSWLLLYSFLEKIGVIQNDDFLRFLGFLKKGIWSMRCFDQWCIVTEFPKKINRDDENKLHSIDGSSIEWKNKDKNYFIHGVSFKRELWEKVVTDDADPFEILKIQNQEQRQAALTVIPLQNILKRTKACCKSSFTRPNIPRRSKECVVEYQKLNFNNQVKLFEIYGGYFNFEENMKIVNYFCPSTGREYFDFVPPHITRASESMAWKFDVKEQDYINNFVVET